MVKRVLLVAAIAFAVWWVFPKTEKETPAGQPRTTSSPESADITTCSRLTGEANEELHQAALLLLRRPVKPDTWSAAESRVSDAISSAESACRGGTSESGTSALTEFRAALTTMRASLSEFSASAREGEGGFDPVLRQQEIERHLSRAREVVGLR